MGLALAGSASAIVDTTAPTTTASFSPSLSSGYAKQTDTVTLTATDPDSSVSSITYSASGAQTIGSTTVSGSSASFAISAEGTTTISFHAVDPSSNVESTRTATLTIDKTNPTVSGSTSPSPNGNNWWRSSVTVSFTCADSLSGVKTCTTSSTLTSDGAGQQVTGQAVDNAGNSASTIVTVNIDKTAPTISGSASPAANANGWRNTNVTVSFSCADALSGVAGCTSPVTLGGDGAGQGVTGTATDKAGNTATATVSGISIDKTVPLVAFARHLGHPTVDRTVTISCTASDPLSGVASTDCTSRRIPVWTLRLGPSTFTATATDRAGNIGTGKTGLSVQVTYASLEKLTRALSSKKAAADALVSLLRTKQIPAYVRGVVARKGTAFTAKEASALVAFARALARS